MSKQIDLEIAKLGSPQFKVRDAATANLLSYREKAFPALMKAMTQNNVEVVNRAKQLVARIRKDLPPEMLEGRTNDVIHTADSKIAGRLVALSLKVHTHQFGEQLIKLPDLLSLREPGAGGLIPKNTLPDPGMLHAYQGQVNKVLFFRVTGGKPRIDRFGAGGVVWGTDTYTLDSTLAFVRQLGVVSFVNWETHVDDRADDENKDRRNHDRKPKIKKRDVH